MKNWYKISEKEENQRKKEYNINEIVEELSEDSYQVSNVDIKLLKKNLEK